MGKVPKSAPDAKETAARLDTWRGFPTKYGVDSRRFYGTNLRHRTLACAALWLALKLAGPVGERLGVTGLNIATRLLGLLLAAFAIENMATGLKALFPGLG